MPGEVNNKKNKRIIIIINMNDFIVVECVPADSGPAPPESPSLPESSSLINRSPSESPALVADPPADPSVNATVQKLVQAAEQVGLPYDLSTLSAYISSGSVHITSFQWPALQHVTELAEWSCRQMMVQRGDAKKWVASFDGFYLILCGSPTAQREDQGITALEERG